MKFDLETARPLDAVGALAINVRDRRFGRELDAGKWWLGGDPVATAWHNTLSVVFPKGEALFIESVKANRAGAPPKLEAEIRAFIRQEVNHTREHVAFNRMAVESGYDTSRVEQRLDQRRRRPARRHHLVVAAFEPAREQLALRGLARAVGSLEGDQQAAVLVTCRDQPIETSRLGGSGHPADTIPP